MCVQGLLHLDVHHMCHLDLKDDNVLVASDGRLVLCDFGTSVKFPTPDMLLKFETVSAAALGMQQHPLTTRHLHPQGMSPGGNQRHLAPEVLSRFHSLAAQASAGETEPGYISYKGQTVRNVTEHPSLCCGFHSPRQPTLLFCLGDRCGQLAWYCMKSC